MLEILKNNDFKRTIVFMVRLWILGLFLFAFFRTLLLLSADQSLDQMNGFSQILKAFVIGIKFDSAILAIIFAPALLLTFFSTLISGLIPGIQKFKNLLLGYYLFLMFALSLAIHSADIPYFHYFRSRFGITAFDWIDSPGYVFELVFSDYRIVFAVFLFTIVVLLFYKFFMMEYGKLLNTLTFKMKFKNALFELPLFLICCAILFIAMRGGTGRAPMKWGNAFFGQNPVLNQLGLNPVWSLGRTWSESRKDGASNLNLMADTLALEYVRKLYSIEKRKEAKSPIDRKIIPYEPKRKLNVVLILMESLGAKVMGYHGYKPSFTPFLDSLVGRSLYFNEIYSAGIHTNHGIFSTLFGFPARVNKHSMNTADAQQRFRGLPNVLKSYEYQTAFYLTHDKDFDNISGFMTFNGYDQVISSEDYESVEELPVTGIPDDSMFIQSIDQIDAFHKSGKPFFVTYLSGIFHSPYRLPENNPFPIKGSDKEQTLYYADSSLRRFFDAIKDKPWFDDTLFVLTGDHGTPHEMIYYWDLSQNHVPLIFYSPKHIEPKIQNQFGAQMDIFPTTMGLLGMEYWNNTLGLDLRKHKRDFVPFSADQWLGAVDGKFFYIMEGPERLYDYSSGSKEDYKDKYPEVIEKMRTGTHAFLQSTQWLIQNRKVN